MKTVGNYCYDEKTDKLGEGTFGSVYKGRHVQDSQQLAAIKSLDLRKTIFRNMRPEWRDREKAILQDMSDHPHPNLVHLLHCEHTPDIIYLIMEFCNGGHLLHYLDAAKILDEWTIKQFFKQIASGLKFLHGRGIVHRDLKPENVLLCFTGDRCPAPTDISIKIADFGVGKFLDSGAETGTICGTALYMAPEIRPFKTYTNRVDLWSVGVMMFECLTGRLEEAPDFQKLKLPTGTSPSLSNLLKSLLVEDPHARLDGDKFLNHTFFGETIGMIGVSVRGPGGAARMIQVNENEDVDVLIASVSRVFNLTTESESLHLIHEGRPLEHGSGSTIKDSGIFLGSNIEFCVRTTGGFRQNPPGPQYGIYAE